jgi:hypothetical protein
MSERRSEAAEILTPLEVGGVFGHCVALGFGLFHAAVVAHEVGAKAADQS